MYRHRILLLAALCNGVAMAAVAAEPQVAETISVAQADSDQDEERESRRAPTDDEALALAALEGLMSQPPARALPVLKKVLNGSQSALVKRRAVFVLSQVDTAEAQDLLVATARANDAELRAEAIRSIGISGNPKSLAVLQQIYERGDGRTQQQVLEAWLISGSKGEVYRVAAAAKTEEEASRAIRTLGAMGARDELRKLGEVRKPSRNLVEAYAIAGDLASLRKIVAGNGEMAARREAVQKIGIISSEEARTALREIYSSSKEPELQEAALQGMLIASDEQGVLALYRASKKPEEKRALLRILAVMDGDAALQAIDAALEGKK